MASVETRYEHIQLTEDNVPFIKDTNMKVVELILNQIAYGWSPEELHFQHPHLSMGQIYSALAYYWDHQDQLEEEIESRLARVNRIKHSVKPTSLKKRLQAKGLH
jgi:uncharacterized protein (DUF433 family)